jgi:hypothetical protein
MSYLHSWNVLLIKPLNLVCRHCRKAFFPKLKKTMNGQENTLYPHVGHELVN